jgi:hypothetical protein
MNIFPRFGVKGFPTLFLLSPLLLFAAIGNVGAEMVSVSGGSDGLCGSRTAKGERLKLRGNDRGASHVGVRHPCSGLT